MKQLYILLDHNHTLVANSHESPGDMALRIQRERYRRWLVELLKPHYVMIVTGRQARYRAATLQSIQAKTGWLPQAAYFNTNPHLALSAHKGAVLRNFIWPLHGKDKPYLAIESGSLVRAMWQGHGIPAIAAPLRGETWDTLPIPPNLKNQLNPASSPANSHPKTT